MLLSVILTIISVTLWKNAIHSRFFSANVAFIVFISFLISGFYFVANYLTGRGIDESVLYHLSADIKGAAFSEFSIVIIYSLLYLLAIMTISYFVYRTVRSKYKLKRHKVQTTLALSSMVLAFVVNPGVVDISRLYEATLISDSGSVPIPLDNEFLLVDGSNLSFNKKNIIYVYLESVERTYLDENLFPDLVPNLRRLESQALSFSDIRQIYGSGWTIAGLVNTQCGIPLVTPSQGNSMSGVDQFLPEANCLGDILHENGYNLNYLGGSSLDFAGKGKFFATHNFDRIYGLDELLPKLDDPNYRSSWGIFDDSLFHFAKYRYDQLTNAGDPFGLFMLTLDTHHPNGHISSYCEKKQYADGSNPILNAVHCTDVMVGEFVDHVRSSVSYKDTIIIISSDHLAMRNSASDMLQKGERKNLLMFLAESIEPHRIEKPAALIDAAPTLLSLLGAKITGLGFGRNLLSESSLVEKVDKIDSFLSDYRGFISNFWSFPQITNGISVDYVNTDLVLGARRVRYPALLTLDENLGVNEVRFGFDSPEKLVDQVAELSSDQRLLWVDQCAVVSALADYQINSKGYCIAYGTLGSLEIKVKSLNKETTLTYQEFRKFFDSMSKGEPKLYAERVRNLDFAKNYGSGSPETYKPENILAGNYVLASSGGFSGSSFVSNLNSKSTISTHRGLTLYGLNSNASPIIIKHLDTCDPAVETIPGSGYKFRDDINRFSGNFGAFVILTHDSAVCGVRDFTNLFADIGLEQWKNIGFRTPYIGIIAGNGAIDEFFGDPETRIAINAKDFIQPILKSGRNLQRNSQFLPAVAHAGGGYNGKTYTNSIDALNSNFDHYQLFEIDFSWTSDDELVCLHDWYGNYKASFGLEPEGKKTLKEFKAIVRKNSVYQNCTLGSLAEWLQSNKRARIVTDVKENNVLALAKIARDYPELQNRFIPQIYQPLEYFEAMKLGYSDIIWTLYRFSGDDDAVLSHLQQMDLYGLTMPEDRADRGVAQKALNLTGVLSYVHTINSQNLANRYYTLGINSIYTDFLPQPIPTTYEIISSGGPSGTSSITSTVSGYVMSFVRGITLVGFSAGEEPVKIAHYDSCDGGAVEDEVGLDGSFADVIGAESSGYQAFVILAHDSAVCGESKLQPIFNGTALKEGVDIGYREPYLGFVFGDGSIEEVNGLNGGQVVKKLSLYGENENE